MTLVAVGLISRQRQNGEIEYLLVSSKKDFGEFTGCFYPPGGHLDDGEEEKTALVREIKEEINLEILPIKKLAETDGDVKDQKTYWWSCEIVGGEFKIDENEIAEAGFFTRAEMDKLPLWPATKKFFNDFMPEQTIKPTGCCDIFDPAPWQEKEIIWTDKIFVKDHVTSLFHIPLNFGKKVVKNMALIEKADAKAPHQLMLTDEKSLWGSDIYIDVAKDVPDAEMAKISGKFLTKVFEGPYQNAGKWAVEMNEYVKGQSKEVKKMYFSYTTCPKCAKAYGKNYVVIFAQVD